MARVLSFSDEKDIINEFSRIGVTDEGVRIMAHKAFTFCIRLKQLDNRAANILKQEMLSLGGDLALPKEAYSLDGSETDAILIGNVKQLKVLVQKLDANYPFGLAPMADDIASVLDNYLLPVKRKIGGKEFDFSKEAALMGIVNVTPDSFSEDGVNFNKKTAVKNALQMVEDGADILDVGGESTRPGSVEVTEKEELSRVIPVIEELAEKAKVPISIDSSKPTVVKAALESGATMINDVTGLRNEKMIELAAEKDVPTVIMHMLGEPRTMQENPVYEDLVADIYKYLEEQSEKAIKAGLSKTNVYIDVGIGFGKTAEGNFELIKRLREFTSMGYPVLYGPSRKSFIGSVAGAKVTERLGGTASAVCIGAISGASIIRVHDVKIMKQVLQITERVLMA